MVPEKDSRVVDLGGDFGEVRLRYPMGALRALSRALGGDGTIDEIGSLLTKVSADKVAVFLWAGMLHADLYRDLPLERVEAHVEWMPIPLVTLMEAVSEAFVASVYGDREKEDEKPAEGKVKASGSGPGGMPSGSPPGSFGLRLRTSGGRLLRRSSPVTSEGSPNGDTARRQETVESPLLAGD